MFGPHLILEAYGSPKECLADLGAISQTLDSYPEQLQMTKIMPPYVFTYHGSVPEDWGVSGIVLIAESHISIHTFPEKQFTTLDIFSCKEFDIDKAIEFFRDKFQPTEIDRQVVMRGREFPRSIGRAGRIMETERLKLVVSG